MIGTFDVMHMINLNNCSARTHFVLFLDCIFPLGRLCFIENSRWHLSTNVNYNRITTRSDFSWLESKLQKERFELRCSFTGTWKKQKSKAQLCRSSFGINSEYQKPNWDGQIKIGRDRVVAFYWSFYFTLSYLIPNTLMNNFNHLKQNMPYIFYRH